MTFLRLVPVRSWRMQEAEPSGMFMWFDPERETPALWSRFPLLDGESSDRINAEVERYEEEGVGPCEGGAADEVDEKYKQMVLDLDFVQDELPF